MCLRTKKHFQNEKFFLVISIYGKKLCTMQFNRIKMHFLTNVLIENSGKKMCFISRVLNTNRSIILMEKCLSCFFPNFFLRARMIVTFS